MAICLGLCLWPCQGLSLAVYFMCGVFTRQQADSVILQPVDTVPVVIRRRDWHIFSATAVRRSHQRGSDRICCLFVKESVTVCVPVSNHLVPSLCGFFLNYSAPCSCLNRADCQRCACLSDACVVSLSHISSPTARKKDFPRVQPGNAMRPTPVPLHCRSGR